MGKEKQVGEIETGTVYEQFISVTDRQGVNHKFRRIRITLKKETRDGDKDISLISNIPIKGAAAGRIAESYRGRWTIETAFQHLADEISGTHRGMMIALPEEECDFF